MCISYRQIFNISRTLAGNRIVDHSDVDGASPGVALLQLYFILDLTAGFNWCGNDNCKARRERFK